MFEFDEELFKDYYAGLLDSLFIRLKFVGRVINEDFAIPAGIMRETAFLQLRMCYETIAIGAIVAHNGTGQIDRLRREYKPASIFDELSKLNPAAFPEAVTVQNSAGSKKLVPIKPQLSRDILVSAHCKCGAELHHRSLKWTESTERPISPADFFASYADKLRIQKNAIRTHMWVHMYRLPSGQIWIGDMRNAETTGSVVVRAS